VIRTNREALAQIAVAAAIAPPIMATRPPNRVAADGTPSFHRDAEICGNARPGCPAVGWAADRLEPSICVPARHEHRGAARTARLSNPRRTHKESLRHGQ